MQEFFNQLIVSFFSAFFILTLAAYAGMFSEKVGIVNIGINGQIIIGALIYAFFAFQFHVENMWFQILLYPITILFTVAFGSLHGLACIKLKANQTITGVGINFLALGIAAILLNFSGSGGRFTSNLQSLTLTDQPGDYANLISLESLLFLVIVGVIFWSLNYTRWGLRLKAVGENPQAADVGGVNVIKLQWQGLTISSVLSAVAGIIFVQKIGFQSFNGTVNGVGFLALAVMIMGRWKPLPILIAAFGFSLIQELALQMIFTNVDQLQTLRQKFGKYLEIVPFVITLISLMVFSRKTHPPQALGQTFVRESR